MLKRWLVYLLVFPASYTPKALPRNLVTLQQFSGYQLIHHGLNLSIGKFVSRKHFHLQTLRRRRMHAGVIAK